ncbi:MAG: S-layer homology domain-containing protein [Firmicutes bacterium]|nr:S-layer homology domain-containing protein [Bacillota bacterium]
MKIKHILTAVILTITSICGCTQLSFAEENTVTYNFTKENIKGTLKVRNNPDYTYTRGYGFVNKSSNMPERKTDKNRIVQEKEGYSFTQTNPLAYNITDEKGDVLDYTKATDYNYGGMIFRVKLPAGGYHIEVETENKENALVSVSGMQTYRLETTKYWDAAKLVENKNPAIWENNTWKFNYANGSDHIDIEIEPAKYGVPVVLKTISITPIANNPKDDIPTIYTLGDSTLKSYQFVEAPMSGWGQTIDRLFDKSKVNVINYSMGGRSLKQMYQEGRLNDVLLTGHEGDYILIQSAHNDEKNGTDKGKVSDSTARFGIGATEQMYKDYLTKYYIPAIKARGMIPVFVTAMTRVNTDKGENYVYSNTFTKENMHFIDCMKEVAQLYDIPLIDLNTLGTEYLNSLGVKGTEAIVMSLEAGETPGKTNTGSFANGHPQNKIDGTHMKEALTKQYSRIIVTELYDLSQNKYPQLKTAADSLEKDVIEAIKTENWDKVYPEVAKDCLTGDNAYYRNQIEKMLEIGVMEKDEKGNFNPKNKITTKEYISAISKIYNIDEKTFTYKNETLTRENMAVINLVAYKAKYSEKPSYMTDYNGTNISPQDPTYDPNLIGEDAQYYPLVGFGALTDTAEITPSLYENVKQAYNLGLIRSEDNIVRGKMINGKTLSPKQEVTREKAAKSLYFMYVLSMDPNAENDIN